MGLYKYVTSERIDILKNGLIRFTQTDALNDPWEMRPYIENLLTEDAFNNDIIIKKIKNLPREEFIKQISKMCWEKLNSIQKMILSPKAIEIILNKWVEKNPKEFEAAYDKNLNMVIKGYKSAEATLLKGNPSSLFSEFLGVLSLTRKPDNSLMWSHYADNHKGFVIEFNENHKFFSPRNKGDNNFNGLTEIEYNEERPHIRGLDKCDWDRLFFFKSKNWKYEKECRLVQHLSKAERVVDDSNGGKIYLFSLPSDCFKSVIFGCRMPDIERQKIIDFIKTDSRYTHLLISKAIMDEKTFSIRIKPL